MIENVQQALARRQAAFDLLHDGERKHRRMLCELQEEMKALRQGLKISRLELARRMDTQEHDLEVYERGGAFMTGFTIERYFAALNENHVKKT